MTAGFIPYAAPRVADPEQAGRAFLERMDARRSVRDFSADPVPRELIEIAVATATGPLAVTSTENAAGNPTNRPMAPRTGVTSTA